MLIVPESGERIDVSDRDVLVSCTLIHRDRVCAEVVDMNTYEVPSTNWQSFLDQFSRQHHGQLVKLETIDPHLREFINRPRDDACGVSLISMTAESGKSKRPPRFEISADDENGLELGYSIADPLRLKVSECSDGLSEELEIKARDGTITRVWVGLPEEMLPPGDVVEGV
jgi:hypothetical protein